MTILVACGSGGMGDGSIFPRLGFGFSRHLHNTMAQLISFRPNGSGASEWEVWLRLWLPDTRCKSQRKIELDKLAKYVIDLGHGLDNIQEPSFMFVMVVGQAWLSIVLMGVFKVMKSMTHLQITIGSIPNRSLQIMYNNSRKYFKSSIRFIRIFIEYSVGLDNRLYA